MPENLEIPAHLSSKSPLSPDHGHILPDPFPIQPFTQSASDCNPLDGYTISAHDIFTFFTAAVIYKNAVFVR